MTQIPLEAALSAVRAVGERYASQPVRYTQDWHGEQARIERACEAARKAGEKWAQG